MRRVVLTMTGLVACAALTACAATVDTTSRDAASGAGSPGAAPDALSTRLDELADAVERWAAADDVADAHAAAEAARNLVVGPGGPSYGDADGDGEVGGASATGLLPSLDASPGLAGPPAGNACIERDVLGGSWDDAAGRWDALAAAIDAWAPTNNTFPSLPSHPQRVVGWATLTLGSDSLDEAHEYAGHARLHVDVSRVAVEACD